MIICLLVCLLIYWVLLQFMESDGLTEAMSLQNVATYPFYGNGPYVWPPLWAARSGQRLYHWPPPNQMGFPIRWMGSQALPLPSPI